jgi:glycosyltransferase involved in cell wall biosynthesis
MQKNLPTVAWFSYFPVEWLPDAPDYVRRLPQMHPASWQRVLLEELEKISGLRLHVLVLRKQFERHSSFERKGVTFHLIKTPGGLRAPSFFWIDTLLIRRKLAEIRPDVVHAWGTENGAALVATRLKYPHVVTVQGLMTWYNQIIQPRWHDRLASVLERCSLPKASFITAESNFSAEWVRQHFKKSPVEQIEHVPDLLFHHVQRRPQFQPIRFIFVGTLDYRKGVDLVLEALNQLRNEISFELIMAGTPNPEMIKSLRKRISAELWSRIVFKENLTSKQVADELSRATIMICATRADTGPVAVKEAVVAGVPVVGSAIGGIPDYIVPGLNGLLFQSENLSQLIEAVRVACRHPLFKQGNVEPETLGRMRDYLSPMRMGRRFVEIYQTASRA